MFPLMKLFSEMSTILFRMTNWIRLFIQKWCWPHSISTSWWPMFQKSGAKLTELKELLTIILLQLPENARFTTFWMFRDFKVLISVSRSWDYLSRYDLDILNSCGLWLPYALERSLTVIETNFMTRMDAHTHRHTDTRAHAYTGQHLLY